MHPKGSEPSYVPAIVAHHPRSTTYFPDISHFVCSCSRSPTCHSSTYVLVSDAWHSIHPRAPDSRATTSSLHPVHHRTNIECASSYQVLEQSTRPWQWPGWFRGSLCSKGPERAHGICAALVHPAGLGGSGLLSTAATRTYFRHIGGRYCNVSEFA